MKSTPFSIDRHALMALVRLAIAGLGPRDFVEVPRALGESWLRRHVTRLHQRGVARYAVQAVPKSLIVTRRADAPLVTLTPVDPRQLEIDTERNK